MMQSAQDGNGDNYRDSRSSLSSRVFSMAMTAWSTKVLSSSSCLFESEDFESQHVTKFKGFQPYSLRKRTGNFSAGTGILRIKSEIITG